MKKIVSKLMDYGMDFQYENYGSKGEHIISFELAVEIWNKEGVITIVFEGESTKLSEKNVDHAVMVVDQICINETASF